MFDKLVRHPDMRHSLLMHFFWKKFKRIDAVFLSYGQHHLVKKRSWYHDVMVQYSAEKQCIV